MNRRSQHIQNLHSLLTSKWLITDSSANGLLPDLARLLQGSDPIETKAQLPYYYSNPNKSFYYYDDEEDEYYDDDDNDVSSRKNSIAILPVKGPILKYSQFCGPMGTKQMSAYLDAWEKDDDIDGVLLDIDSGGGQASGTPEFAARIKAFSKPIVVYSDGMICSAAYWIAAATDYIVVNEFCDDIGSIGTMAKGVIVDGIIEKAGGKIIEEYATKSTEKNHTSRELRSGNSKPYIEFDLDPINDRFHDMMRAYRPQLDESVFTGVSYVLSKDALDKNLVDEIGSKATALNKLSELISEKESNNQSNIDTDMSKKNYSKIASVIGLTEVFASSIVPGIMSKTASFTEEQLDQIEDQLSNTDDSLTQRISQLENELKVANENHSTLQDSFSKINTSISAALTANNLEAKATPEENIALLSAKVTEYGAKGDAVPTNVHSKGEGEAQEEVSSTSIFDSLQK